MDILTRRSLFPPGFVSGIRDAAPTGLPPIPFGLVIGVTAVNVGFSKLSILVMSIFVMAGASQLAAIELASQNAPIPVIVATALVINLRFMMYSAAIAPQMNEYSLTWRGLMAYVLLDVNYSMTLVKFGRDTSADIRWYYLGTSMPTWTSFTAATIIGMIIGNTLPNGLHLEFAAPLLFISLLFPHVEDVSTGTAGVIAGLIAILGVDIPFNMGSLLAAGFGIASGLIVERRLE